MPTYEYLCSAGHRFEQFQRMSDAPIEHCPQCGARAERQLSGAGLLFKGSGFYITDYRSDSYKKAAEADQSGTKPAAEKSAAEKPTEKSADKPADQPKASGSGGAASGGKAE